MHAKVPVALLLFTLCVLHAMLASGSNANDETWTGSFLFIVLFVTKHAMFIIEGIMSNSIFYKAARKVHHR